MSNHDNHISDDQLLQVIDEAVPETKQREMETHISTCVDCQTRLMKIAANENWRDEYRDCLTRELLSTGDTNPDLPGPFSRESNSAIAILKNQTPDEDLESIHRMLSRTLLPPTHPETLGKLGRYEIESVLGRGGMGVVLRGYDHELHRPVAIKCVLPRLLNNGTAKQRFAREARATATILHPNVIAIHDIDESNGVPWFVMPLIAGPSLRELVNDNGPLPEKEIARIGLQIASGLAAAHGQGLVHRDIKPENILVDNQVNRVVITDFGLARRDSDETMTQTGVLAGTLNYMAPEQIRDEELDSRSDLFSVGCLLYFLATGAVPFRADSQVAVMNKISNVRHPDVRSLNPDVSKTMSDVIDKLLEKQPENRFQSAVDLEIFLESYVAHLNQPTRRSLPGVPRTRGVWKTRTIAKILVAATLLIAVCFGVYQFIPGQTTTSPPEITTPQVSPADIWNGIQADYGISSPAEFKTEFSNLDADVQFLDRHMEQLESFDSHLFENEATELQQKLNRFSDEMDNASSHK